MAEFLNIVDEGDNIIGQEDRIIIHREGLLHREIHVYFITPNKEIIFQHRAKDKDTYPDLLDATVGGHVEIGDSYEQTAIKEAGEETGIKIDAKNLIFIAKVEKNSKDETTKKINHAFQSEYLYIYDGGLDKLKIEAGCALGFESWPIDKLLNIGGEDKKRFIPYILKFATNTLPTFINNLKL
jgi:isopentenyldiphosphate isomerase